jgi:colanic acid/amylovoran biosynthesis protein
MGKGIDLRVLVLWADSKSGNYGVRVLADGMAELARRAWGDDTQVDYQDYGIGDSDVALGTKGILRDLGRKHGPIKSKFRDYDVMLDSGAGDSFSDIYGLKRLSFMINAHRVASKVRVPLIMGPQTIGPFDTAIGRMAAKYSLSKTTLVQVRDSESARYAKGLGRPVDLLATDVVFALPRVEVEKTRDVVVNVSGLLWFSDRHGSSANYRRAVMAFVKALNAQGRTVALLAHVVNPVSVVDDAAAIRELVRDGDLPNEVIIPSSVDEIRACVASAQLVIGARMHACLNALSTGTPAIPWAYSRKFAPLMTDIGWGFGVDLRTDTTPEETTLKIMASIELSDMRAQLQTVLEGTSLRLDKAAASMRAAVPGAMDRIYRLPTAAGE